MRPIVVGVDGSAGSVAALRWAVQEARLRGAPLRLVHAFEAPHVPLGDGGFGAPGMAVPAGAAADFEEVRAAAETQAKRVVEGALDRVAGDAEGLDVRTDVIEGRATPVLLEAGREAELLAVGTRGRGGFAGLLLGSVSQQCAQHPPCPVVILPPAEDE